MQMLLTPIECAKCGNKYQETGYWRDEVLCPACSINERRLEDEKKEDLRRKAAEIQEKYGLDFSQYPEDLDAGVREFLNPRNAGRKARKYQSEYCELLVDMANEGKQEVEFAARIGISQSLITYWTEIHPKFKQARETANEARAAWLHKHYRLAMLGKIDANAPMMIRQAVHQFGWSEKSENTIKGTGGEIPVVKIVERDAGFPAETLEPSAQMAAEAGQGKETA